ncbi:MAG TPA: carbamoyl phosphate synthase small subunit [Alphaproteobacteria bacterium]|jgi:carbamoyl-phosphate synthase small subunit|nr:carbamoyl phosphate synthase small subunit [Alphaproteobacteria bacterium]
MPPTHISSPEPWRTGSEAFATAAIVLADGTVFYGNGIGAAGEAVGEICFNTAMTGYQEILTDPSYAGQIVTFTFPHIGNVGVNPEDVETGAAVAEGLILHAGITDPSNYRASMHLDTWLKSQNLIGVCGVDTRALTARIRQHGMPNGVICHRPDGKFDIPGLREKAANWPGLEGMDLAIRVSGNQTATWDETLWQWDKGYGRQNQPRFHVVAVDFGAKRNILRCLASTGCRITLVHAKTTAEEILDLQPDGVFLSNGPGDPAATGEYAVPMIRKLVNSGKPVFGICLGHQMLALALGARTGKMLQGHHGANHPVKDLTTGKVEITSMNHGFTVLRDTLPKDVAETHISLFDGTNCGIALRDRPVFSVQFHPEASPGPQDSFYLFERFIQLMQAANA